MEAKDTLYQHVELNNVTGSMNLCEWNEKETVPTLLINHNNPEWTTFIDQSYMEMTISKQKILILKKIFVQSIWLQF